MINFIFVELWKKKGEFNNLMQQMINEQSM
jgi:hypothetical protein